MTNLVFSILDEKREFDARYQTTICEAKTGDNILELSANLDQEKEDMLARHKMEEKKFDSSLVMQLDQKVLDQQMTLEKAGVPGFHVTNNPTEIQVQMCLLDFIIRLSPGPS